LRQSGGPRANWPDAAETGAVRFLMKQSPHSHPDHPSVYYRLKEMLIDYELGPGQPISINEIADRFRVSATPVRESLIRLRSEGFLDPIARRGFVAKVPNLKEMIDLHAVMFLFLVNATEHFGRVDRAAAALPSPMQQMAGSPGTIARHYACYVETTYEELVSRCHNDVMRDIFRNACERTRFIRTLDFETGERRAAALRCLEDAASSLRACNAVSAAAILRKDFEEIIQRLPALVKESISRCYASAPRPVKSAFK
jgi:DNA-binding GntR family transcriptional regulator